jgi:uncharacterized membrane-anchored protein YjiN (DUF445 family)
MSAAASPTDADRQRQLRRMKLRATLLLVVAAAVFVVSRALERDHDWLGWVRATAEAAMVGGLADWFAVTALFRHPLGLPIPHTAIVPTRKDQIGESLGEFVQENFLSREAVVDKLRAAHVGARLADWLVAPGNAGQLADQLGTAVGGLVEVLRDEDVAPAIEHAVLNRLRTVELAPVAGRVLDLVTANGRHQELLDASVTGIVNLLDARRDDFRKRFATQSPWWVPEPIDDRIFDKIFNGLKAFLGEVSADPRHELRQHLDERVVALVEELKVSPAMRAKGEELKEELLAHPAVQSWARSLWSDLRAGLLQQSRDPSSELRTRAEALAVRLGASLRDDPVLQGKVERWVESVAGYVVEQYRHEVADLISSTVRRWDAHDTSRRIEVQIGRDLQFIRINGTVVGGLAGLAIHGAGRLIG